MSKKDTITKAEYSGEYMVMKEPEIIEKAFNINIINRMLKQGITVFVEGETDEKYFNTYIERYLKPSVDIRFQWIGAYNNKGNAFNTGDTGLTQPLPAKAGRFNVLLKQPKVCSLKVIFFAFTSYLSKSWV